MGRQLFDAINADRREGSEEDEPSESSSDAEGRRVLLREEHDGDDDRYQRAHLYRDGDLQINGHDMGPGTALVSSDGEYEWEQIVARGHIPALLETLGAPPGANILDELEARWTGPASDDLERQLREGYIAVRFWCWP